MNNNSNCDIQNIIKPSSSSLTRAPSWSFGVGGAAEGRFCNSLASNLDGITGENLNSDSISQNRLFNSAQLEQQRLSINIPTVYLTKKDPSTSSYHVYQLDIKQLKTGEQWSVYRRYSQFYALHQLLRAKDPNIRKLHFPPKRRINSKASTIVQDRRRKLEEYIKALNFYLERLPPTSDLSADNCLQSMLLLANDEDSRSEVPSGSDSVSTSGDTPQHQNGSNQDDVRSTNSNGYIEASCEATIASKTGKTNARSLFNDFISLKDKKDDDFDPANLSE